MRGRGVDGGRAETLVCAVALAALTVVAHATATEHTVANSGLVAIVVLALSLARVAVVRPTRRRALSVAVLSQLAGHVFLAVSASHDGAALLPEPQMAAGHVVAALLLGELLLRAGRAAGFARTSGAAWAAYFARASRFARAAAPRVMRLLGVDAPFSGYPAGLALASGSPPPRSGDWGSAGWCGEAARPLRGPPLR